MVKNWICYKMWTGSYRTSLGSWRAKRTSLWILGEPPCGYLEKKAWPTVNHDYPIDLPALHIPNLIQDLSCVRKCFTVQPTSYTWLSAGSKMVAGLTWVLLVTATNPLHIRWRPPLDSCNKALVQVSCQSIHLCIQYHVQWAWRTDQVVVCMQRAPSNTWAHTLSANTFRTVGGCSHHYSVPASRQNCIWSEAQVHVRTPSWSCEHVPACTCRFRTRREFWMVLSCQAVSLKWV